MKPWFFLGISETAIFIATQVEILPDNLVSILVQLPLVAVVVWLQLQNQRWLERMLEVQRVSIKETYASQQIFLDKLLSQMDAKQEKMISQVELLAAQIALCNATVGEVAKVDDVIDRLLTEVRKK